MVEIRKCSGCGRILGCKNAGLERLCMHCQKYELCIFRLRYSHTSANNVKDIKGIKFCVCDICQRERMEGGQNAVL